MKLVYKAKRIDNDYYVKGFLFKTPLTDENSGIDSEFGWFFLSDGKTRWCISDERCVVYVVDETTITLEAEPIEIGLGLEELLTSKLTDILKAKDSSLALDELHKTVLMILNFNPYNY